MTVDLLAELERIRVRSLKAQRDLSAGLAVSGTNALNQIEKIAEDAIRLAPSPEPREREAARA